MLPSRWESLMLPARGSHLVPRGGLHDQGANRHQVFVGFAGLFYFQTWPKQVFSLLLACNVFSSSFSPPKFSSFPHQYQSWPRAILSSAFWWCWPFWQQARQMIVQCPQVQKSICGAAFSKEFSKDHSSSSCAACFLVSKSIVTGSLRMDPCCCQEQSFKPWSFQVSKDLESLSSRRFQGFNCTCPCMSWSSNRLYNTYCGFQFLLNFFRCFPFFTTNNKNSQCYTKYHVLLSISCAIALHRNFDPFFGIWNFGSAASSKRLLCERPAMWIRPPFLFCIQALSVSAKRTGFWIRADLVWFLDFWSLHPESGNIQIVQCRHQLSLVPFSIGNAPSIINMMMAFPKFSNSSSSNEVTKTNALFDNMISSKSVSSDPRALGPKHQ